MAKREYELVVYGATGFTGRLVSEYLAGHASSLRGDAPMRWAIAGRSRRKLERVAARLPMQVGIIEADASDGASLEAMAAQARVVVTTVGPYAQLGEPLVKACLAARTDYLDITGEPAFVDTLLARYDAEARDAGVLIINCCGFDSIPADLGTLYTVQQLPEGAAKSVRAYVKTRGKPSGGTWASLVGALADGPQISPPAQKKEGGRSASPGQGRRRQGLHREPLVGGWAIPMPVIDPLVVKRSSREHPAHGPDFRYAHYLRLGSLAQVAGLMGGVAGIYALSQTAPTRRWLLSRRPSGAGPSEEERKKSFFEITFIGEADGARVVTRVSGGDPGYDETSKMLAESALLVASARDTLNLKGGVVTPAAAMGEPLIERLRAAGIVFETLSRKIDNP
jgi:short subunit dehydrogenase-like uncharacterized protein